MPNRFGLSDIPFEDNQEPETNPKDEAMNRSYKGDIEPSKPNVRNAVGDNAITVPKVPRNLVDDEGVAHAFNIPVSEATKEVDTAYGKFVRDSATKDDQLQRSNIALAHARLDGFGKSLESFWLYLSHTDALHAIACRKAYDRHHTQQIINKLLAAISGLSLALATLCTLSITGVI